MATTTATLTLSSADLSSQPLSITSTMALNKAGTVVGLDQSTGLSRKVYAAAQTDATLISASDYDDNIHAKVYIKNPGTSSTDFFSLTLGASNISIGRLYGGDFIFLPYEGEFDIDISSSTTSMELEFIVIYQAA